MKSRPRWPNLSVREQHYFAALVLSMLFTALIYYLADVWGDYGYWTFVIIPFLVGLLASGLVQFFHWEPDAGRWAYTVVAHLTLTALAVTCLLLLILGLEGLICILLAIPITAPALGFGIITAVAFYRHVKTSPRNIKPILLACTACALLLGAATFVESTPAVYKVITSVIVDAPIENVWDVVVEFPDLPPPTEWLFKAGIAYPMSARLEGMGVGAIRYCEFSTGAFVEPITVWEAPRRLAFTVTECPAPMVEWNLFYEKVEPPHLHGFMESERSEFLLESLPDGRTRLSGNTWYSHGLQPAWYWRVWSDHIIHSIHRRVLEHVKSEAERQTIQAHAANRLPDGVKSHHP